MTHLLIVLGALITSLALNAILLYSFIKAKDHLKSEQLKTGQKSYEVKNLLQDLAAGEAMVRFERVNPSDVFLRGSRGK